MEKLINLKDPETDEIIAQVNLLSIDWYDELSDAWNYFLEEIGFDGTNIEDFIEYFNKTTNLKIEKCKK